MPEPLERLDRPQPASHPSGVPAPACPLGRYRHYKGKLYEVVGLARHSETLEWLVVYRALYGDFGLWVRPATMFAETVEFNDATVPRFEFLGT